MNRRGIMLWGLGTLLVGSAAVVVGTSGGKAAAAADLARLQILWPAFSAMPEGDRAFLVGLSMTCRLHTEPVERAAIVACLRAAAVDPNVTLPKGYDKGAADERLTRLLTGPRDQ